MSGTENPTIAALDDANAALAHIRQEARRIIDALPQVSPYAQSLEIIIVKTIAAQASLRELRKIEIGDRYV